MKRNILILLYFCLCSYVFGDEIRSVTIKANEQTTIESDQICCSMQVSAVKDSETGGKIIRVMIENTDKEHPFLIFKRTFTEKDLKKHGIRFGKQSGCNDRTLKTCEGVDRVDVERIVPQDQKIFEFQGNESTTTVEIPIYIAKYKNKKKTKFLILESHQIDLDVTIVPDLVSEDNKIDSLQNAYEDLVRELQGKRFCPNSLHNPSLSDQEQAYKDRIKTIKDSIRQILSSHNGNIQDAGYRKCKELSEELDLIDFSEYEEDCGKHTKKRTSVFTQSPSRKSANSSRSVDEVLTKLERVYKKLDRGKMSKQEAVRQADSIKGEWDNSSEKKNADPAMKRKIDRYYNLIVK